MQTFIVMALLLAFPVVAFSDSNGRWEGDWPSTFSGTPLPVNGLWYYSAAREVTIGPDGQGGWMSAPPQTDLWEINAPEPVLLDITDIWITGDRYEVYLDGFYRFTTPAVPFGQQPEIQPDTPGPVPFQRQAALDSAFADPRSSSGTLLISPGLHYLNVKDISFPPGSATSSFGVRVRFFLTTATEPTSWGRLKALYR